MMALSPERLLHGAGALLTGLGAALAPARRSAARAWTRPVREVRPAPPAPARRRAAPEAADRERRGRRRPGLPLRGLFVFGLVGLTVLNHLRRPRPPADLRGQVVLITGGSRGLGFALAREFARAGCRLVICGREAATLERARALLERDGASVLALVCDVSDREQVERLVAAATDHYGGIDILVNNAGVIQVGPFASQTLTDFEQAMGVNFWGGVYTTLAVVPGMRARRRGRIVNITSIGGKLSVARLLPYSAAKFAATGFSEGLRAALARDGITVTTIAPGLMRTGSPLNAEFKGQTAVEFTWFTVGDSLPFLSMDAEEAARQIVLATRRGEAERILGLPAVLAARFHALAPGLSAGAQSLIDRLLPSGAATAESGAAVLERLRSPLVQALVGPTLAAARRFNQHPLAGAGPAADRPANGVVSPEPARPGSGREEVDGTLAGQGDLFVHG
jgi:NAD(P)-dependent dehydrogenase (short-subunit alcohol dehydrogenase family)